jgi:hypothetical protein
MATAAAAPHSARTNTSPLPGRRYDHYFFSAVSLLMLGTVFYGFARTYYLAGVFRAPLPSALIHIHGAVFTLWILLLVTQTSLVAAGRVDIHKRLGIAGFLLGCAMVALGVAAATDSLVRGVHGTAVAAQAFYLVPMSSMAIFATLLFFAFRARRNPAEHKRLICIATSNMLLAAIVRWPVPYVHRHLPRAMLVEFLFIAAIAAYDLWSTHKIHRATLWAGALVIVVQELALPVGMSAPWQAFAAWVRTHG